MSLGCSKDEHLFLLSDPMPDRVNLPRLVLSHMINKYYKIREELWPDGNYKAIPMIMSEALLAIKN